jgi:hypothetical protein
MYGDGIDAAKGVNDERFNTTFKDVFAIDGKPERRWWQALGNHE